MMRNAGNTTPIVAQIAPSGPPCDAPTKVAMFTAMGPGVDSHTPMKSRNASSVSQPCASTVSRTSAIIP